MQFSLSYKIRLFDLIYNQALGLITQQERRQQEGHIVDGIIPKKKLSNSFKIIPPPTASIPKFHYVSHALSRALTNSLGIEVRPHLGYSNTCPALGKVRMKEKLD